MDVRYGKNLKRGVLEIVVLKLLSENGYYADQLVSRLNAVHGGMLSLKEGSLYPILYRLEDCGYIASSWIQPDGAKAAKKSYTITDDGRQHLKELLVLWQEFRDVVDEVLV